MILKSWPRSKHFCWRKTKKKTNFINYVAFDTIKVRQKLFSKKSIVIVKLRKKNKMGSLSTTNIVALIEVKKNWKTIK